MALFPKDDLLAKEIDAWKGFADGLRAEDQAVKPEDLAFTTRASKDADDYKANSVQRDAMLQLKEEGESIRSGQKIQYVITDYSRKTERTSPLSMVKNKYDVKRYVKLLAQCCSTVTKPFGTEVIRKNLDSIDETY